MEWSTCSYGGWKKSCTTLDGWTPIDNGINHLSTGAGFLPSTVVPNYSKWPMIIRLFQNGTFNHYSLVNIQKTMKNHHFLWVNQPSMAIFDSKLLVYQAVYRLLRYNPNNPLFSWSSDPIWWFFDLWQKRPGQHKNVHQNSFKTTDEILFF